MASWGRPMSTVGMDRWALLMLPKVEPPGRSARLLYRCTGTPAARQASRNTAPDTASVVYFWLALYLRTTPPFSTGRSTPSYSSGWAGWTAWALSADTMKLLAAIVRQSRPRAVLTRSSTSVRKVESAPCRVPLPTSSLLNTHNTGTLPPSLAARKPSRQANTHWRSSSLGAAMNSPSAPSTVPGVLGYKNSSVERMSSSATPAASASSARKRPVSPPQPNRGSRSVLAFNAVPLFTSRSRWMATLGITTRSRSTFTSRVAMPPSRRTTSRPATDRGRSSQERAIMPP